MPSACPLFIDDRAGSRDLLQYLPPETEPCRLEFGDAMIVGNGPTGPLTVGVEIKSISDLLSSANTGRLAGHQLPGMLATYDSSWILYYGPYRPGQGNVLEVMTGYGKSKGWRGFRLGSKLVPYGYLESFLFDVAATGVKLKHVWDEREAAIWLQTFHRWWSKEWTQHKGLHQFDCSKDLSLLPHLSSAEELVARVATQLPGIGFDRAVAAAGYFTSVEEMVNASSTDWENIPGIGKVIARTVTAAIKGE